MFSIQSNKLNCIVIFAISLENLKNYSIIYFKKTLSLSNVYSKCGHAYAKIFKDEESIEILRILGLINNIEEYQKIYSYPRKKHESRI